MDRRRDAGLAAAEMALRVEEIGRRHGGVATTGALALQPGIPTAVAGEAELLVDLRHPGRRAGRDASIAASSSARGWRRSTSSTASPATAVGIPGRSVSAPVVATPAWLFPISSTRSAISAAARPASRRRSMGVVPACDA